MGKWTRRDLVKAGLAASAGVMTGGELLAEPRLAGAAAFAQAAGNAAADHAGHLRERLLLDYGWRFALGNANDPDKDFGFGKLHGTGTFAKSGQAGGPAAPRFDDSAWRKLDLPHDWAVELPFVNQPILIGHGAKPLGREYPETSIGWYRREFVLPASDAGRRISVEFDGMFRNATVFFNGHYITENMSGYAPLALDLTDFANFGSATPEREGTDAPGRNVLVVRVDASLDEGWFYEGAGIYRHVWLTKTAPVHIARWGNFVRADFGSVTGVVTSNSQVTILVTTDVANDTDADVVGRVRAAIVDPAGKTVATAVSDTATVAAREGDHVFHAHHGAMAPANYVVSGDSESV